MTRDRLEKEIAHYRRRVTETRDPETPQERRIHTQARNNLRRRLRMLRSLEATGSVAHWIEFPPEEDV